MNIFKFKLDSERKQSKDTNRTTASLSDEYKISCPVLGQMHSFGCSGN